MRLSVILPTFNRERRIREQLDALSNQAFGSDWELIVADNGSTDGTLATVETWRHRLPLLRVLDASGVRGQSHARNRAAQEAAGDALLFTDDDDIVCPDWIARMVEGLSDSPIVTGPVSHFVDGRTPPWSEVRQPPRPPTVGPFASSTGCNLGIDRQLFLDLGGFDETMTRSWEDVDLGIRAALQGFPIGWVEGAVVLHRRPDSARAMWHKEYSYGRGWTTLERRYPELSPNGWLRPLLRRAGWVAARAPSIAIPSRRRAWVVRAANVAGRFVERLRPSG
jgi:glycosyltransferase involved in cell wall biosynthesis